MSGATNMSALSPTEKRRHLERLLREKAAQPKQYKVSFGQERLWFVDRLQPNLSVYNLGTSMAFAGPVDAATMQQAVDELVRRHEVLRTRFGLVADEPVQIVEPRLSVALAEVDLSAMPESTRSDEAMRLSMREAQIPFDLTQAPLIRFTLLRVDRSLSLLVFAMHHIVSDGWSLGILMRELRALYESLAAGRGSPLPPLAMQYGAYAESQRRWLQGETLDRLIGFWTDALRDAPQLIDLPADRPRPPVQTFRGAWCNFDVPRDLCDRLRALGRRSGATLYMIVMAAFQTLLMRYGGQTDIVVGTPVANRNSPEQEAMVGLFANMLAIRGDLDGNPSFLDLLARTREMSLEAQAHQDLPFERLVEALQPARDLGHHPLFQVMFAYQNIPSLDELQVPEADVEPEAVPGTTRFDLSLFVQDAGKSLRGTFEYSTDLFDHDRIVRMIGHLRTLLEAIAAHPERRIWDLPLLTGAERKHLAEWNATETAYARELALPRLFEEQARLRPDAIAASSGEACCTYAELNRRANQLAHRLRTLGVRPETVVGLCVDRSLDVIVGLLGILKAGGAYLPLDPGYPADRLGFMMSDARAPVLVTSAGMTIDFTPPQTTCLRLDADALATEPAHNPGAAIDPGSIAYLIYTSGSTGVPKGVQVSHSALSNFLYAMVDELAPSPDDRLFALTTLSFDIAALEIFLPLISGGQVVVGGRESALDARLLADSLARHEVTMMQATPVTWRLLVEAGWRGHPRMKMITGGERLPQDLADEFFERSTLCWNLYGPTEATVYATGAKLAGKGAPVTIGRPLANMQAYVLDRNLNQAPIGVPGDLHLGGAGLARGYLNRPDITADRFIPDPFGSGRRLYRTGDIARFTSDGAIEYLGRSDFQVKVRGFRIELGEIESVLLEHPAVRQAVVAVHGAANVEPHLAAYAVPDGETPPTSAIYEHLRRKLPDYMLPSALVWLDALPLTPNGKIDRKALPEPESDVARRDEDFVGPRTPVEGLVAAVWMDVLGLARIDVRDDFFSLGGHSLLAARVMYRLSDLFRIDLPLIAIFRAPSVEALSRELSGHPDFGAKLTATAETLLALSEMPDVDTSQPVVEERAE